MRIAIIQSNYIPWRGYFDIIGHCDRFVFHDDVQYTKNDWRNRNRIRTEKGAEWLTIPCGTNQNRLINEVLVNKTKWQETHYKKISNAYSTAPSWKILRDLIRPILIDKEWETLSAVNQYLIKSISAELFQFQCEFIRSEDLFLREKRSNRVLEICKKLGATEYISGPSARNYIQEDDFLNAKIKLKYFDYSNYAEYKQIFQPFINNVSIVDLIANEGVNSKTFLKVKS